MTLILCLPLLLSASNPFSTHSSPPDERESSPYRIWEDSQPLIHSDCKIVDFKKLNENLEMCEKTRIEDAIYALVIYDKNLTLIPNLVKQTPNISIAVMSNLNSTSISSMEICKWENLTVLLYQGHKLSKLPSRLLSDCNTLFNLGLANNEITEMETDTFVDLSSLRVLNLSKNQIEILDPDLFKSLINLEELYLRDNCVQTISPDLFQYNKELFRLDLSHNKIKSVHDESFQMSKKLRDLLINWNQNLTNINLKYLDLLNLVVINNCMLKTLFIPSNVVYFYANHNQLSHITLQSNSKLELLKIAFNNFTDLIDLRPLTNLHILDLSNNGITNISLNNFFGLNKLIDLQLNSVSVRDINIVKMTENMPALQRFNITSDRIHIEYVRQIQQDAQRKNISVEIYHNEKTNFTSFIKDGIVEFWENSTE